MTVAVPADARKGFWFAVGAAAAIALLSWVTKGGIRG